MDLPALREAALGLLLDRRCLGCGAREVLVCPGCAALLRGRPAPVPPRVPGMPPCWATAVYDGPVKALLAGAKERGQVAARRVLAEGLALAAAAAARGAGGPVLLVPVPSTGAAVRARGDDVVLGLARDAAGLIRGAGGVEVAALGALRSRRRRDQVGLSTAQRRANVRGSMAVVPRWLHAVRGAGAVVVVDDVVTSGASLAEAAAVLRSTGARVVAAAAVAATPRRGERPDPTPVVHLGGCRAPAPATG